MTRDHPAGEGDTPVVHVTRSPRLLVPLWTVLGLVLGLLPPVGTAALGAPRLADEVAATTTVARLVDTRVSPSPVVLATPGTRRSILRIQGTVAGGERSAGQAVVRVRVTVVGTQRSTVRRLPSVVCTTCDLQQARFNVRARVGPGKHVVRVQALARGGRVLVSQELRVRLAVPSLRVRPSRLVPGSTDAARIKVRSGGVAATALLQVRDASGATVWSRSLPPGKRWTATWARATQSGGKAGPGRYRVTARVTPVVAHSGRSSITLTRAVRVTRPTGSIGRARLTPYGYWQPVRVTRPVGTFHLEVHQRSNQLLVVGRNGAVVRHIPITGNLSVGKPSFSRVQHRTALTYDFGYQWRLPWFVNLIAGRSIGSHAIPRHVTDGHPIMAVSQLGRSWPDTPVSAGCLRMHDVNARWVYDNVPNGTPVYWLS